MTAIAASLALALPAFAGADTFTVTATQEGSGSLREAVAGAEAHPGPDTIGFAPALRGVTVIVDPYNYGPLEVTGELRIDGPGVGAMTLLSFGGPMLHAGSSSTVTIAGLEMDGKATGAKPGSSGGLIQNEGAMSLGASQIEESTAGASGGAISNTGTMTIADSTLTRNRAAPGTPGAAASGGAIVNSGTLAIDRSQLLANAAVGANGGGNVSAGDAAGGAIDNTGALVITNSTLGQNRAQGGSLGPSGGAGVGGAIHNAGSGSLTVRNSTFVGNAAAGGGSSSSSVGPGLGIGGALENVDAATFRIEDSTLVDNSARPGFDQAITGDSFGGAVDSQARSAEPGVIVGSTLARNAARRGGNIDASGPVALKSTLLADPKDLNGGKSENCGRPSGPGTPYGSKGYNLEDGKSCPLKAVGDQSDIDPQLDDPADNGGPTQTMAIRSTSPALDQGVDAGSDTDQRSKKRPVRFASIPKPDGGDGADIGAYELQDAPKVETGSIDASAGDDELTAGRRSCITFRARKLLGDDPAGAVGDVEVRFGGATDETGKRGRARICARFERSGARFARLTRPGLASDRVRIDVAR